MAQQKVYTVSKRASKGWKVKKRGGKVISKTATKATAIQDAAKKARKQKSASVVIVGLNGRIQEERTYPSKSNPGKRATAKTATARKRSTAKKTTARRSA